MERISSWETNKHSAFAIITRNLPTPLLNYRTHNSLKLALSSARLIQSAPYHPIYLLYIWMYFHLRLRFPSVFVHTDLLIKTTYAFILPNTCETYSVHLAILARVLFITEKVLQQALKRYVITTVYWMLMYLIRRLFPRIFFNVFVKEEKGCKFWTSFATRYLKFRIVHKFKKEKWNLYTNFHRDLHKRVWGYKETHFIQHTSMRVTGSYNFEKEHIKRHKSS